MKGVRAELRKSHHRHHSLVSICISLFVLLWAAQTGGSNPDRLSCGYSALFYAVPVMNTVVMPLGTAALVSRIWDIENKENNCRLLFTLQSRRTLFCSKTILGLIQILLICLVEGAGLLALGKFSGYTELLDWTQFWWMMLCTLGVNVMLFFLWLWLSIRFTNQVPTLAAGMVGSLSGLFAAFMPAWVSHFMPWGYYIPLSAMRMDWNQITREVHYAPIPYPAWLLAVTAALLGFFAVGAWRTLNQKEV